MLLLFRGLLLYIALVSLSQASTSTSQDEDLQSSPTKTSISMAQQYPPSHCLDKLPSTVWMVVDQFLNQRDKHALKRVNNRLKEKLTKPEEKASENEKKTSSPRKNVTEHEGKSNALHEKQKLSFEEMWNSYDGIRRVCSDPEGLIWALGLDDEILEYYESPLYVYRETRKHQNEALCLAKLRRFHEEQDDQVLREKLITFHALDRFLPQRVFHALDFLYSAEVTGQKWVQLWVASKLTQEKITASFKDIADRFMTLTYCDHHIDHPFFQLSKHDGEALYQALYHGKPLSIKDSLFERRALLARRLLSEIALFISDHDIKKTLHKLHDSILYPP